MDKFDGFGKQMRPLLQRIPDAVMWQYRLQLSVYKKILEKYYGAQVAGTYVVGATQTMASSHSWTKFLRGIRDHVRHSKQRQMGLEST